jgi:hypothetical protein
VEKPSYVAVSSPVACLLARRGQKGLAGYEFGWDCLITNAPRYPRQRNKEKLHEVGETILCT